MTIYAQNGTRSPPMAVPLTASLVQTAASDGEGRPMRLSTMYRTVQGAFTRASADISTGGGLIQPVSEVLMGTFTPVLCETFHNSCTP